MKFQFFQLPLFKDKRGKLVPLEFREQIPFPPKRLYYIFGNKESRGGHAHKKEKELFICLQGTVTARINDGRAWHTFLMKGPADALYVPALIWHEFTDFSKDAILLALSSIPYDPEKKGYIIEL